MTQFDDRRQAFEKKFALDEELRFKATVRRNKAFGLWAAAKLGRSGPDAEDYARSVVNSDFEEAGDHDVLRKVRADLEAGGVRVDEAELRTTMDDLMTKAVADIQSGA